MTLPVMPNPKVQFFDDNGAPLAGGKIYSYEAGTSTPKATYSEATGTTANANPVILDSRGEALVYLSGTYKIVLKDSDDVQVWSVDNVSMMPYTTVEQSEWVDQNLALTYSSATVFTVPGDVTATFPAGRRVKATVSAGTVYGVVKSSAYTTLTTVTVVLDSGSLDSGLSDISVGLIMPTNTAFPNLYALPRYTTTQRDALTAAAGMMIYNTTTARVEAYYGSAWRTIADGSTAETLASKTLTEPTIASFTNANHDHSNDAGGAQITATGITGALGAWTTGTNNNPVQAATDLLVMVYLSGTDSSRGTSAGYTDSSNPPTTIRAREAMQYSTGGGAYSQYASYAFPVKKGDYWKVVLTEDAATVTQTIYAIPIGS